MRCSSCCWASARRWPAGLLMFDAMTTEFSEVRIWRDPACPACGEASPWLAEPLAATALQEVPA